MPTERQELIFLLPCKVLCHSITVPLKSLALVMCVASHLLLMTVAETELEQIQAMLMIMSLTQFHSKYAFGVVATGNHKALF